MSIVDTLTAGKGVDAWIIIYNCDYLFYNGVKRGVTV